VSPCSEERSALLGFDTTHRVIEIHPTRVTPKGRTRGPDYLFGFNYPPLLSGQPVTITLTTEVTRALRFDSPDESYLHSALDLLAYLGYDDVKVIQIRTT
jgi:hypothetical protein